MELSAAFRDKFFSLAVGQINPELKYQIFLECPELTVLVPEFFVN